MSKRKLANVSVEEFFKEDYENTEEDTEEEDSDDESGQEDTSESPNKKVKISESAKHRASLKSLEQKDPEFYKFLKESDRELLQFDVSSSDSENEEECHQLPEKLEVASDDSEYEGSALEEDEDEDAASKGQITIQTLNKWRNQLRKSGPLKTLKLLVKAFRRTVETASGAKGSGAFVIEDNGVFNSVIRLCLTDFVPTVNRILKINPSAQKSGEFYPSKKKPWKRIQATVKMYVLDVVKILSTVSEPSVVQALLSHIVHLIPYYTVTPKISKILLKKLIHFWSTAEESVRVVALVCIVRITRLLRDQMLEFVIKNMYVAYVKNCKFTSVSTWPTINFMKHSLVEIFALNQSVAYQHAFVYIRQLAIHLRNAITLQKKESVKTVYNWQYIHCLNLWGQLLCTIHPSEILKPLLYPLVQTIIGTIKLLPAAKYLPLRFHCIRLLINISNKTDTFIPVLPHLLEALKLVNFNQKNARVSWKPMQFLCMLKLSKLQLTENGFKDAVLDQFYDLTISTLNTYSHTLAFPELILPPVIELKSFLKSCHVANYAKQIKQLLDKMEENRKFIENRRKTFTGNLSDGKAVEALENQIKQQNTPIGQYFISYRKLRDKEIIQSSNLKEMLDDYDLPMVRRQELIKKQKEKDRVEFKELFGKDNDDSSDEIDFKIRDEDDDSSGMENEAVKERNNEEQSCNDVVQETVKVERFQAKKILEQVEKKHGKSSNKQDQLEDLVLSSSASEFSDEDD